MHGLLQQPGAFDSTNQHRVGRSGRRGVGVGVGSGGGQLVWGDVALFDHHQNC